MGLQIVSVDHVMPQPWRNGGGITRELWTWPSPLHWLVRISVADVTHAGPFSAFPEIDRWLAVVEGAGATLQFPAGQQVVTPDSGPLHFDGALSPGCRLQAGAIRDLNLMTLRRAGRGTMRRVQAGEDWLSPAPLRAIFTARPLELQIDSAGAAAVPAWTLAVSTDAARQGWRAQCEGGVGQAWWLSFEPGAPA